MSEMEVFAFNGRGAFNDQGLLFEINLLIFERSWHIYLDKGWLFDFGGTFKKILSTILMIKVPR